jgi:hypothetical protein
LEFASKVRYLIQSISQRHTEFLDNRSKSETTRLELHTEEAVGYNAQDRTDTFITKFNSSERAIRSFCSNCGTNIAYLPRRTPSNSFKQVDITVGSLDMDCEALARPDRHGWWNFGVDWVKKMLTSGDAGLIKHPTGSLNLAVQQE